VLLRRGWNIAIDAVAVVALLLPDLRSFLHGQIETNKCWSVAAVVQRAVVADMEVEWEREAFGLDCRQRTNLEIFDG
jgi:hypothetical protein